jgi:hypothetical protein
MSEKCQKQTFQFRAPCEPTERVYQRGVSVRDQLYHEATWKRCAPNGTDTSKRQPIDITPISAQDDLEQRTEKEILDALEVRCIGQPNRSRRYRNLGTTVRSANRLLPMATY